jgi:hypothetical protein
MARKDLGHTHGECNQRTPNRVTLRVERISSGIADSEIREQCPRQSNAINSPRLSKPASVLFGFTVDMLCDLDKTRSTNGTIAAHDA